MIQPPKPSLLVNRSGKPLPPPELADDEEEEKDKSVMYKAAGFCLMQGSSSVSLIILNKYLATFFDYPILTLITQNGVATLLSILVWALGVGPTMQPWKKEHFFKVVPMACLFTILLYTSFRTMGHLSIATVVIFRNAGPLFTAVGEYFLRGEQFSPNSLIALGMMIVGGFVYSMGDLHFDGVGYLWAAFNLLMGTAAGLFGKSLSMDLKTEQSGLGLACYQNIVSVPMFVCVAYLTGEAERWRTLHAAGSGAIPNKVIAAGLVSCVACVTMGISTFELQRLVSQATVAVANVSYKLITLLLGVVIFGNNVGLIGFVGLSIAQGSAVLYVYERQFGASASKAKKESKEDKPSSPSSKTEESSQLLHRHPASPTGSSAEPAMKEEV